MITQSDKLTAINSNIISEFLTNFLRIKNRKIHNKIVLKFSRGERLANVDSAYLYLEDLLIRNIGLNSVPAIIQDRMVSYAELKEEIETAAKFFHYELKCKKGDNLSICAASSIEGIIAFFAMNKLGLVNARIFNDSKEEKLLENLIDFDSEVILTDLNNYETLKKIVNQSNIKTIILMDSSSKVVEKYNGITVYSWRNVQDYGKNIKEDYSEQVCCDDRASILYTSGSSGEPKPISILNRSYVNMVDIVCGTTNIKKCDGERVVGVVSHEYPYAAINCTIMILLMGKTLIMPKHVDNGKLDFTELMTYEPNRIQAIPNFYKLMQDQIDCEDISFSYMSTVVSGGESYLLPEKIKLISYLKRHSCKALLIDGFGFGELGSATALKFGANPYFLLMNGIRAKSVNPETGEDLGLDKEGILCITGPTIAEGYYNNDESTKRAFVKDADGVVWFHSDTYGFVHGKDKRRICLGGRVREYFITDDGQGNFVKVYAGRVENVIASLPYVVDCVVVPSDRGATPKPVAFVSIQRDAMHTEQSIFNELKQVCMELETFARPIDFLFEKEIVRTSAGKKDYRYYENKYTEIK